MTREYVTRFRESKPRKPAHIPVETMKKPNAPSLVEAALDLGALVLIGCFLLWVCNAPLFL
jgi:hypothetical protein